MSICIAFNLSDGLVMAVDSATTMSNAAGETTKVFLDADKLFQLGNLRIGIATYGVAAMEGRTIGSFIREFARWLVDFVLGHYRFAETHPIVGGKTKIGVVAYDHAAFRILE